MGLAGNIDGIGYHMRELRTVDDRDGRVAGFGTGVSQIKMEGWSKGRVALVGDYSAFLCVANGRTRLSPRPTCWPASWPGRLASTRQACAHISDRSRWLPSEFRPHLHQRLGGAVPAPSSDLGVPNLMVGGDSPFGRDIKLQLPDYCWPALALARYRFTRPLLRNSISAFQCLNAAGISDASVSLELAG